MIKRRLPYPQQFFLCLLVLLSAFSWNANAQAPDPPAVTSPVNYCKDVTSSSLSATAAAGNELRWYDVATGGTSSTTAPTPSTSAAGTTKYYVSQYDPSTSLESDRDSITVVVNDLPSEPTIVTPVDYCQGATASALYASGTSLQWYTAATGGTGSSLAPVPSTTTVGTTTYYVTQTDATTGCESSRAAIAAVINALPTAPTVTSPVTYCATATASALTATGSGLKWYDVATGGTATTTAPTPSTASSGTTTYYVSQTNATTGCEGPRSSITVDVNALPSAPTVTTPVTYCAGATASILTATGTNLLWYSVAGGGTGSTTAPTPSTATAGTTTYYVSQTDGTTTCEGPRASISVVVNALPSEPTATSPVNYCVGETPTALSATGTGLIWYTSATGGSGTTTAPTPGTASAGTTTYYVSQTDATTGCEGPRAEIEVVVNALPTAPTVTSPLAYCEGSTASALTATGTGLLWYDAATGGTGASTAPTPSTASSGTTTYYVSQTDATTGCEGPRASISVEVNTLPSVPSVTTPVNYCKDATATALSATGASLLWYDVATGGTGSATAPTPSTATAGTTIYYVSQTDGTTTCEGPRASITVVVNATSAPTVTTPVNYCEGATATALSATGTSLLWYDAATGGTGSSTAPTPSTATAGTTNYYVSQTDATTSCESPRAEIEVVVNSLPAAPTVTATVTYCVGETASALSATGSGLLWYTTATGGTGSSTAPTPSTTSAGTTSYYVSQTNSTTGCEGPRAEISVVVNPLPVAPTVTSPVNLCLDGPSSALTATGTDLLWYDVATGGTGSTTAPTPSTSATGTTNYYVSQTSSLGCGESPRATIAVVVNALPSAPTVTSPVTYCSGATASALTATGTGLLWYDAATGGTGATTAPTPSTASAGTTSYYVSQTSTVGCEGSRAEIEVVVNATPSAPTVTTPVNYCAGATASALTATGSGLLWYTTASGGTGSSTAPTPSTATTGTTNYYVSQTDATTGCESPRALIAVVVNSAPPAAPTVTSPVSLCVDGPSSALTATGTDLLWYDVATGGTGSSTAPTPSTSTAGTTNYYVSQTSTTGCGESARSLISVVVNALPSAPTVTSPVTYCKDATATALTATGSDLLWYDVATGGTGATTAPTPGTSTAGTTNYYVTQTSSSTGCESSRSEIEVVINPLPSAPTVTTPLNLCMGTPASALTAGGTGLLWYDVATGGTGSSTAPTPSTSATGTTTYYVSQTNSTTGCEGPRSAIVVNVNAVPSAPTVSSPVTYCSGTTATALTATGTDLLWYDVATGGTGTATAPTPSTTTAGSTTYYVSQTNPLSGCESPRSSITVDVNASPSAPTVTSPVNYCLGATASALTATGTDLLWYDVATGGTGSTTAPTPSTTTAGTINYYVSQTNTTTGCESPRALISVVINTAPSAPTVSTPVTYCAGETASALTATGTDLLWYDVATGGTGSTTAPTPSTATAGTTSYYVSQSSTLGCGEGPRAEIEVVVNPLPSTPTVTSAPVLYCRNEVASPLSATGTGLLWYDVATGGTGSSTAPTPNTAVVGVTTYYVTQTDATTGCESPRAMIVVNVRALPSAPTVSSPLNLCLDVTASPLTATGTGLLWYDAATGGTGTATAPTPTTTAVGSTSYYVSQTDASTGCESPRAEIAAVVNDLPSAPTVTTPVAYCEGETAVALTATGTSLLWYDVATGGTGSGTAPTPSTSTPGSTDFYVTQTSSITGCESPRATITVDINPSPVAPTVTSPLNLCLDVAASPLTATGTGLLWYDVATGGTGSATAPTPSTTSLGTTSYYVSQTSAFGCGESPRAEISVVVNSLPASPTVTSPVTYCAGATATALSATGTDLLWYDVATGGTGSSTAPTPSTTSGGTTKYYVTQTSSVGCESLRDSIAVVVNETPAPSVTTPVAYCEGETTSALTATGTSLLWYDAATGGTGSTTAPTPSSTSAGTTNYYVSQTDATTGCESQRALIAVVINGLPAAPSVTSPINYCEGETALALTASGTDLLWYDVATGGTGSSTAPTPSTASAGTTDYYVSQTSSSTGCEGTRATISVVVNPTPSAPVVSSPLNLCLGGATAPLTATGIDLLWYTAATGGSGSTVAPTPSTGTLGTKTYYVTQTSSASCESDRAALVVTVQPLPTVSITSTSPTAPIFCPGKTIPLTAVAPTATTYQWSTLGTPVLGATSSVYNVGTTGISSVLVTDVYGCQAEAEYYAQADTTEQPVLTPTVLSFCPESSGLLNVHPALLTYSYQWFKDGAAMVPAMSSAVRSVTDEGNYYVVVTNNFGCLDTTNHSVVTHYPSPVKPTLTFVPPYQISVPTIYSSYQWYQDGIYITGAINYQYNISSKGYYHVRVTNEYGCENYSDTLYLTTGIGGPNNPLAAEIRIFPNPTRQIVFFQSPVSINVSVVDITGKEVLYGQDVKQMDMGNLADGTYYFRIFDADKQLIGTQKITKVSQ